MGLPFGDTLRFITGGWSMDRISYATDFKARSGVATTSCGGNPRSSKCMEIALYCQLGSLIHLGAMAWNFMVHLGEKTWWFYPNLLSLQGCCSEMVILPDFCQKKISENLRLECTAIFCWHKRDRMCTPQFAVSWIFLHLSQNSWNLKPFLMEGFGEEMQRFPGKDLWSPFARCAIRELKGSKGESEQCLTKRVMAGKWMRKGAVPELSKSHQIHLNQELRLTVHS